MTCDADARMQATKAHVVQTEQDAGLGFGVWGLGVLFGVESLKFEISGLRFQVGAYGLWFMVYCLRFG